MIVVANRIPVTEEYEDEFEERMESRLGLVDDTPGFIRNVVLRPLRSEPSKAATYVIMTFWQDLQSFEAWTRSESFKKAHANRPPKAMFSGPSTLEIHEVIQDTARKAKTP